MRFRAECANRHGCAVKAFEQIFRRLYLANINRGAMFRFQTQHIANGGNRTLIHRITIQTILTIIPTLNSGLQRIDHFRVIRMIFTLRFKLQQTTCINILAASPCPLARGRNLLMQISKRCPFHPTGNIRET